MRIEEITKGSPEDLALYDSELESALSDWEQTRKSFYVDNCLIRVVDCYNGTIRFGLFWEEAPAGTEAVAANMSYEEFMEFCAEAYAFAEERYLEQKESADVDA